MFDRRLEVPQGERPHEAADEVRARRLLFLIFRINDHPCQLKVVVVPQGGLEQSHFVRGRAHGATLEERQAAVVAAPPHHGY